MLNLKKQNELKNCVSQKNITSLVHFTRVENLNSIISEGLFSVKALSNKGVDYIRNDLDRRDNLLNAISVSIQHPNYRMFYRKMTANQDVDWVVIRINPNVLWSKDCLFCIDNAANSTISRTSENDRRGIVAFKKMFENIPGKPTRKESNLYERFTSNPQAEVLVLEEIESELILEVAFQTQEKLDKHRLSIKGSVRLVVDKWLFDKRYDYMNW